MSTKTQNTGLIALPELPVEHAEWLSHVSTHPSTPMHELLAPYKTYDAKLREVFAQQPSHPAVEKSNVVPLFTGKELSIRIRARKPAMESEEERQCYLMPLAKPDRKPDGAPAIVQSFKEFQMNFQLFSESALADMDWSNVVVAGSAVVTSLLPVPANHNTSKRALREYYHQELAPASDVDLFLYGLTEEQAIEKIKQIEQRIRDSILTETTTIRTKNAITIASQYPMRHVQIVLRIYRSISEILTGFDVDCSCAAYDGEQVYASPRAVAAYITQINTIDLTRRSPSYENRLSKYSHRGFEVYWPLLDRARIDPTIFERSFGRTLGLARLLVLEKLPSATDRDAYLDQRRAERGRPAVNRQLMREYKLNGNVKDDHEDEIPDWVKSDEVSNYHTFIVPYGPKFHARKIERLLYAKDLLLNAEWNRPKHRETTLHRHPAFFGNAIDVIGDCCGYCPKPETPEDKEIAEVENVIYVSGDLTFIKDDPGRQAIGSFHPLTDDDWTEMAYVSNTARLCQAIVDGDVEHVQDWLKQEGADPNKRDYTGRTPLQLAAMSSTIDVVQTLIDAGARIVACMADGRTALHLASMRGDATIAKALLIKSKANEEKEIGKKDLKAKQKSDRSAATAVLHTVDSDAEIGATHSDEYIDIIDSDEDEQADATTEGSIVNIRDKPPQEEKGVFTDENEDEPDVYDINVLAWDTPVSPLHLAITNGHVNMAKLLVQDFGADVLLPVKLVHEHNRSPRAAILTLVLALQLPTQQAAEMTQTLINLGASPAQADLENTTPLHYFATKNAALLTTMVLANQPAAKRAVNHLKMYGSRYNPGTKSALQSAIEHGSVESVDTLLELGAQPQIDFGTYICSYKTKWEASGVSEQNEEIFRTSVQQPVLTAVEHGLPYVVTKLLDAGADVNCLSQGAWQAVYDGTITNLEITQTLLDATLEKIKSLENWIEKEEQVKIVTTPGIWGGYTRMFQPVPLKEDASYLEGLEPGTYAHWSTLKQLQEAKRTYEEDMKKYNDAAKAMPQETHGWKMKMAAAKTMLTHYISLKSALLARGAKTFRELRPDIKLSEQQKYRSYDYEQETPTPWTPSISFHLPDLTDKQREAYVKLFEACWDADLFTVKELTLAVWAENQTPLKIAVQDNNGLSPFSIAVLRENFDIARVLLEIAQIQFAPEETLDQSKYSLYTGDLDNEDGVFDSDKKDEIRLFRDTISNRFTVENIGEVQSQAKSRVTALDMLAWSCPVSRFLEEDDLSTSLLDYSSYHGSSQYRRRSFGGKAPRKIFKNARSGRTSPMNQTPTQGNCQHVERPGNLFQLAIFLDDASLLRFLIDAGEEYTVRLGSNNDELVSRFYSFNEQDFRYAIQMGRVKLLSDIIKRTGAGIPLDDLVKNSGVETMKKPKYYQGLTVHGKKRTDWATAGRDKQQHSLREKLPPLLYAARYTNLDSVEWFLSDAVTHAYSQFLEKNKDDLRIQGLANLKGDFQASIGEWLNLWSDLLIHAVILSKTDEKSLELLQHLCRTHPDLINHRSATGITPLQLAFSLHRIEMAKILIESGADQTSRNHEGDNLLHSALSHKLMDSRENCSKLHDLFCLIDTRLMSDMFTERSASAPGATTPLARWIYTSIMNGYNNNSYGKTRPDSVLEVQEEVLRIILDFSSGSDLDLVNSEGDTPVHAVVRHGADHLLRPMLSCRPELLFRENASGRTPYEMAEDAHLAQNVFRDPPSIDQQQKSIDCNQAPSGKILEREPESFVGAQKDERNLAEKVWDACKEFKEKANSDTKRKLVSLLEANEVAKRLAEEKIKIDDEESSQKGKRGKGGKTGDEMNFWYEMGIQADRD